MLDDGKIRLAIVVVDTCMMTRELIDDAKALAASATGITMERMLISATHTHSAPSAMACLGTSVDANYAKWLPGKIADGIALAVKKLAPARIGWTATDHWEQTNCRRWITRPDKMQDDPFGEKTVRAMMHPGYENPDYIAPAGPIDPGLSLISVQALDGRPLALLANYSMHYFGAPALSADYYGRFSEGIPPTHWRSRRRPGVRRHHVARHQWRLSLDGLQPAPEKDFPGSIQETMMRTAAEAVKGIDHWEYVSLAMAETKLTLRRRLADEARLAWARKIVTEMGDRIPKDRVEVYAREQVLLAAEPERELKLQAVRIGDFGITAIPNEVYAITGLKLKAQSPLQPTMNIELANGSDGYIPPPEQPNSAVTPPGRPAPPDWSRRPSRASWRQSWACWKKFPGKNVASWWRRMGLTRGDPQRQTARLLAHERVDPTGGARRDRPRTSRHLRLGTRHRVLSARRWQWRWRIVATFPGEQCVFWDEQDQSRAAFRGRLNEGRVEETRLEIHRQLLALERVGPDAPRHDGYRLRARARTSRHHGHIWDARTAVFLTGEKQQLIVRPAELLWKDWHHVALVHDGTLRLPHLFSMASWH